MTVPSKCTWQIHLGTALLLTLVVGAQLGMLITGWAVGHLVELPPEAEIVSRRAAGAPFIFYEDVSYRHGSGNGRSSRGELGPLLGNLAIPFVVYKISETFARRRKQS